MIWRALLLAVAASTAAIAAGDTVAHPPPTNSARSDYVEYCAGCHGVNGSSAPAKVPQLKGRAGYFLCTPRGREYLIRLPNVARARVTDAQALADLMNYIVFDLGQGSAPANAKRFDAQEVEQLRKHPLIRESLVQERKSIVSDLIKRCSTTPTSLHAMF